MFYGLAMLGDAGVTLQVMTLEPYDGIMMALWYMVERCRYASSDL